MSTQEDISRLIAELAAEFAVLNMAQVERVLREMRKVRSDIAELLSEYAEADGTIKRQKLSAILRGMQTVEDGMRIYIFEALESVIRESAEFAVDKQNAAFIAVLGVALLPNVDARTQVVDAVTKRIVTQKGSDLLNLSDRVWNLSGDMRAELTKVVRADILKQEAVSTMIRNVRQVHDNETWKIKRMVVTEANTAHRKATGESAHKSEVVTAIKLIDERGRHGNHERHACYKLAESDEFGLGKGVYPTSERARLEMPHIQCTSHIEPVIDPKYLSGE